MPEPGEDPASDFHLVRCQDPEDGVAKLLEIVARRIPARFGLDPIRDVQVLCPMNRGGLGARSLNLELQRLLNPPGEARVERFGWTFGPGDKVMQVVNDYEKEVFNGDLGLVKDDRRRGRRAGGRLRRARGRLRFRRAGRAGAGLRHHGAQGAGLGVPGRGDPGDDPALPDAAAEPALHRRDPRPEAGGAGGAAEGGGDRGQGAGWSAGDGRSCGSGWDRAARPSRRDRALGTGWGRRSARRAYSSVAEIAEAERISKSYVSRILRLALLAPDLVEAILGGWADQRVMLEQRAAAAGGVGGAESTKYGVPWAVPALSSMASCGPTAMSSTFAKDVGSVTGWSSRVASFRPSALHPPGKGRCATGSSISFRGSESRRRTIPSRLSRRRNWYPPISLTTP